MDFFFFNIFGFFDFFVGYFGFFGFFRFFSKLLRLLLNVTEFTNEHQKLPKISTNSVKSIGQSPPQELEVPNIYTKFLFLLLAQMSASLYFL